MEIENCPVEGCGGRCYTEPIYRGHRVRCGNCSYQGPSVFQEAEAIAAHNTLARHAEIGRLVEELAAGHSLEICTMESDRSDWCVTLDPHGFWKHWSQERAPTLVEALRILAAKIAETEKIDK